MNFSKTTISGYIAALMSLLFAVSAVPTELQSMIMSTVPHPIQPYLALIFALAAAVAKSYQSKVTPDIAKPVEPPTIGTTETSKPASPTLTPPTLPPTAGYTLVQTFGIFVVGSMLTLIAVAVLTMLTGCANYAGPTISFTAGYEGISAGFTLFGRTPIAPVPQTVAAAFPLPSAGK